MKVTYIKKSKIPMAAVWNTFKLKQDRAKRWQVTDETPRWVVEYLKDYRKPSLAYPSSYFHALRSQKFAKLVCENEPAAAVDLEIGIKDE